MTAVLLLAFAAAGLSPLESLGHEIYHRGTAEGKPIRSLLNRGEMEAPSSQFPCANCHGVFAEGGAETGLAIPPIRRSALLSPAKSGGPFSPKNFQSALVAGTAPDGRALHSLMPRYLAGNRESEALWAYLDVIGGNRDAVPGVSPNTIRIAYLLPLSGPFAERGRQAESVLLALAERENKNGGIYGRQLKFVAVDLALSPANAFADALQLDVAAVLAPWPGNPPDLTAARAPVIGVWQSASHDGLSPWAFSVLPQQKTVWTALLGALTAEAAAPSHPCVAVSGAAIAGELANIIGAWAKANSISRDCTPASPNARIVIYAGPPAQAQAEIPQWAANKPSLLLVSASQFVGGVQPPPSVRIWMASPVPAPDAQQWNTLPALLGPAFTGNLFQSFANTAAATLFDALRRSGRNLHPRLLRERLEETGPLDTGTMAPVTFNRTRHDSSSGIYVLERTGNDAGYVTRFIPVTQKGSIP